METREVGKELAELTAEYKNSLSDKRKEISALKQQIEKSDWGDATLIQQLYQRIHKLAGSAGSYGFDEISEAAIAIDSHIKIHRVGSILDKEKISAALELLIKLLANVADSGHNSA